MIRLDLVSVFAVVLSASIAQAARVPAPDLSQGDGGVSSFYTWTAEIPAEPGKLLRTEPLDAKLGLTMADEQVRILYTSTDGVDDKTPIVVSGAYFAPKGAPPPDRWPLLAWAHGTTGLADTCAPSWNPRSGRDANYLNTWLRQGYAIVATDYQGLGTPGPHPYLAVRPEAYSVLDSVRAVLKGTPNIANRIVLIGQSQGGGAAFAAAGIAPGYAPELAIRGSVVTGIPFIDAALAEPQPQPQAEADPTVAYDLYIGIMAQQGDTTLTVDRLVTERALPMLQEAPTTCISTLFRDVKSAGLNQANALQPGFVAAIKAAVPQMLYTTVKLPQPLFVGTGEQDHDVPPAAQRTLVRNACAAGSLLEAHLYAGRSHSGTVKSSLRDSVPFVRKVLAGEPITSICEPVAE